MIVIGIVRVPCDVVISAVAVNCLDSGSAAGTAAGRTRRPRSADAEIAE
jgi:hypothetical protein